MLRAGLDAMFGRVPFGPVITVLDAVLVVVLLMGAGLTYVETRKIRSRSNRTHKEFVTRDRRLLALGWPFVIIGGVGLLLDMLDGLDGEPVVVMRVLGESALLIWGVACLWCQRILASLPQEPAPGQAASSG